MNMLMFEQTSGKKVMVPPENVLAIEENGTDFSDRETCQIHVNIKGVLRLYDTYVSFNDLWEMFKIKEHVETGNYKEQK